MHDEQEAARRLFSVCGWDLQIVATMTGVGAGIHLGLGLLSGQWDPICGRSYVPEVSLALGAGLSLLSVLCVVAGQLVKGGNLTAMVIGVVISWLVTLAVLRNLTLVGEGLYELFLWGVTAVFVTGGLRVRLRNRPAPSSTDGRPL